MAPSCPCPRLLFVLGCEARPRVFVWSDSSSDVADGLRRRLAAGLDVIAGAAVGAKAEGVVDWVGGAENVA